MFSTINETKTPSELVEWLRMWANGYEDGDALDDNDARQIADAVERVCAPCNAAVNERDRLRDIVRRLLPLAETTVENIRALGAARFPFEEHIKSDRLRADINREVSNADYLLREARAAIGEDAR